VTQYDVEAYQRLEGLINQKLEQFPADESTVLILQERVNEAQRLAVRELREMQTTSGGKGKKRGGDFHQGDDEGGDASVKDAMASARGKKRRS
jgi:ATP-dependent RNA helicase DDX47/RRP3